MVENIKKQIYRKNNKSRVFDKFSCDVANNDTRAFDKFTNISDKDTTTNIKSNMFNNHLEKHEKYLNLYKSNEFFWGLGIENEFYLECTNRPKIKKDLFLNNHKRERYSVNYFMNYKEDIKDEAFSLTDHDKIDIPYLINSHSFTDVDKNNQHKFINQIKSHIFDENKPSDEKEPVDENKSSKKINTNKLKLVKNPSFLGKTLGDEIFETNTNLKNSFNNTWLYDGDTFEITTLNFYKTDMNKMIDELQQSKKKFIENIQDYQKQKNLFSKFGKIKIMEKNYPFAIHMTNLENIGIFNNGTLHYNITLPSELNNNKTITNISKFEQEHKEAIKMIQLFEPLLISVYNTPDYFSQLEHYDNATKFSACSQRCAVSRYIGLGTFDTDVMKSGKILLTELANYPDNFWYNKYHSNSAYNKLSKIGLDINYNKHYNHGIEIRFLDHISDPKLVYESFEFIIYLIDLMYENNTMIENPIKTEIWNNLVCNVMINGNNYNMTKDEINYFEKIIDIKLQSTNIIQIYYEIFAELKKRFSIKINDRVFSIGKFSKYVLLPHTFNIKYNQNITKISDVADNINQIINIDMAINEINQLNDINDIPDEVNNLIDLIVVFNDIKTEIASLGEINDDSNEKLAKILQDINQVLSTSVDIINYNISKIFNNKNKINTENFAKIIKLLGYFKIF